MTQQQAAEDSGHLTIRRVTFPIDNLSCGSSGSLIIERAILRLNGVRHVYVNPATEMAYVEFDPCRCTLDALTEAVEQVGFQAGAPVLR